MTSFSVMQLLMGWQLGGEVGSVNLNRKARNKCSRNSLPPAQLELGKDWGVLFAFWGLLRVVAISPGDCKVRT